MQSATIARLKTLRTSLQSAISTLQSQRAAIQTKIANGTATDSDLQALEELADQIAAKTWDKLMVENELGGLA